MKSPIYVGAINTIFRESEVVARALRSFFDQKFPPQTVYLIDQNRTPLVFSPEIAEHPSFRHLHRSVPAVSQARNQLPKVTDADWIVFCDDDGFLDEGYSEAFQKCVAADPALELIAGTCIDEKSGEFYTPRHRVGGRLDTILGTKLLLGANFCIRPALFESIGRYDERLGTGSFFPSSEETDLCWKAFTGGAKMVFTKELVVYHPPPHVNEFKAAFRKAFAYGRGKGALVGKWIFERRSRLGLWELLEMSLLPFVKAVTGSLRGDFRQIPLQFATFAGRYVGLMQFGWTKINGDFRQARN